MGIFSNIVGQKKVENTVHLKPFLYTPEDALSLEVEQFKSLPLDDKTFKRINDELGEPHPFDYKVCEGLYANYGLISGMIDKIIDFTIGPGVYIECEDKKGKTILQKWVNDNNLVSTLRPYLREACLKGSGYIEVAVDAGKNVLIKPINSNTMYVKRKPTGEIEKFYQYLGDYKVIDKKKIIPFEPDEICQLNINQIGDCAYGLGYVNPALDIINNFLMSQKSLHVLMKRKAGAPIHVKLGNMEQGDIPSEDDITNFGKRMQVMNEKTEWVTGDNCQMDVLNFGNVGERYEAILDNDFLLLSYAFQIPEVLLGKGNVPEGLARVQMDAFERRIIALQQDMEKALKEKIFDKILNLNGLDVEYRLRWGELSTEDIYRKLNSLAFLVQSGRVSPGMLKQVEKDIANTLDYNIIEMEQDNEFAEEVQAAQFEIGARDEEGKVPKLPRRPLPAKGEKERKEEEVKQSALKVPGQNSKEIIQDNIINPIKGIYNSEICPHCVEESAKMKVSEWTNYNLKDIEKAIIKVIEEEKFNDLRALNNIEKEAGYLSDFQIKKLKEVLKKGFKEDLSIKDIEKLIKEEVKIKELREYNMREVKDRVLLSESARVNMIARTETTRVSNLGAIEDYKSKGVEHLRWVSTLGSQRLCEACESLNGEVVKIGEAFDTAYGPKYSPPAHANCRCGVVNVEYKTEKNNKFIKEEVDMSTPAEIPLKENLRDIKDLSYSLDTTTEGKVKLITPIITGCLKAIIVDSPEAVQLRISLAKYPTIEIYKDECCVGNYYRVPVIDSSYKGNEISRYTQSSWILNDELMIEIGGRRNAKVNITFRVE